MFFADNRGRGRLVLTHCHLADVQGLQIRPDVSIVIEDGVVAAVRSGSVDAPAEITVDLGGALVTPGFVDAHVHLCLDAGPDSHLRLDELDEGEQVRVLRDSLERNLAAGVTTVRDVGSRIELLAQMRSLEASAEVFPTVLASGPVLTVPDGHAAFFGEAASPSNIEEILERAIAAGADHVKLVSSGGNLSPQTDVHSCQYSDEEFAALTAASRAHGLDVACHAHGADAVDQCLRYGVRSIEHGSYMTPEQLAQLGERGISWVPTLAPGTVIAALSEAAADRVARRRENLRRGVQLGVPVAAGTDAGIAGAPHGIFAYELDEYVAAGMSRMQALRCGSLSCAEMMRIADRKGRVHVGADADLLVFARGLDDPEFSFHAPAAVVRGGVVVKAAAPVSTAFADAGVAPLVG